MITPKERWEKNAKLNQFLNDPFSDDELMQILRHCQALPENWALKIVSKLKERENLAVSVASLLKKERRTLGEKLRDIAEIIDDRELYQ